jgi:serine/threonine protein kinase
LLLPLLQSKQAPDLQRRRVLQEVAAMHMLLSHPHSVKLIDAYEDEKAYHIIMELLKGGLQVYCWQHASVVQELHAHLL